MLISLLFLHSYSKAVPEHLLKAREAISETALQSVSRKPPTCFAFVNEILAESLAKQELEELTFLHKKVLASLPPSHLYPEIIPYHYALIVDYLLQKGNKSTFWRGRENIHEAKPGDILIYIDPAYDPDPSDRKPNQSAGTHVAFVDEILQNQSNTSITMRIIDSSKRKRGRGISPDYDKNEDKSTLKAEGIAYSLLSLNLQDEQTHKDKTVWNCKLLGQRNMPKFVSILYPSSSGF